MRRKGLFGGERGPLRGTKFRVSHRALRFTPVKSRVLYVNNPARGRLSCGRVKSKGFSRDKALSRPGRKGFQHLAHRVPTVFSPVRQGRAFSFTLFSTVFQHDPVFFHRRVRHSVDNRSILEPLSTGRRLFSTFSHPFFRQTQQPLNRFSTDFPPSFVPQ